MMTYDAIEVVVQNITPRTKPLIMQALARSGFLNPIIGPDWIKAGIACQFPAHVQTADDIAREIWAVAPGADVHYRGYTAQEWIEAGATLLLA